MKRTPDYKHMHFRYPKPYTPPDAPYFKYASYSGSRQVLIVWFNDIVNTATYRNVTWDTIHMIRVLLRLTNSWYIEARRGDTIVWNFTAVY